MRLVVLSVNMINVSYIHFDYQSCSLVVSNTRPVVWQNDMCCLAYMISPVPWWYLRRVVCLYDRHVIHTLLGWCLVFCRMMNNSLCPFPFVFYSWMGNSGIPWPHIHTGSHWGTSRIQVKSWAPVGIQCSAPHATFTHTHSQSKLCQGEAS